MNQHKIIIKRLLEFIDPFYMLDVSKDDIWPRIKTVSHQVEWVHEFKREKIDDYDAKRIAHFVHCLERKLPLPPIQLDNYWYDYRQINLPLPTIVDGYHRLLAHMFLKKKTIEAEYSGVLSLLDYLTGRVNIKPE